MKHKPLSRRHFLQFTLRVRKGESSEPAVAIWVSPKILFRFGIEFVCFPNPTPLPLFHQPSESVLAHLAQVHALSKFALATQ